MGEVRTVLQKAKSDKGAQVGDIVFDATLNDTHTHTASASSNNVETGAVVSDHVDQQPDEITLEGIFSDLEDNQLELGRAKGLYESLVDLKESGEPVTVITGLRVYNDMVIEEVSTTRDAGTGLTVPTSMKLVEQKRVDQQLEDIPPPPEDMAGEVQHTAAPETERGKQSGDKAGGEEGDGSGESEEGDENKQSASLLYKAIRGD